MKLHLSEQKKILFIKTSVWNSIKNIFQVKKDLDISKYLISIKILENIKVIPIPWVTAFTTALMASGMQMNHFLYLWFLPLKKGRQTLLNLLVERKNSKLSETMIIYESVHRIEKTLKELWNYFWENHKIVVARELTKKFEEFIRWEIFEIIAYFKENPSKVKWEFVILF